jgi:heptosyltransferase-2
MPTAEPAREHWAIVMPTWFGDCLMATPALRAMHHGLRGRRYTVLIKPALVPLIEGLPGVDDVLPISLKQGAMGGLAGFRESVRAIRSQRFDTAVLLPNSFRAALAVRLAGVPRRIGYDRDGRGLMLTDKVAPPRDSAGRFTPVSTLDYYLTLAQSVGGALPDEHDRSMRVAVRPQDASKAQAILSPAQGRPVVVLNPGAQKPFKRWAPQRFAQLAAWASRQLDAAVAITGSPAERSILDAVLASLHEQSPDTHMIDLLAAGGDLHLLKAVMQRAAMLVTNDTGARHLAAAVGTPVATLFGPTTPDWTVIHFEHEEQVVASDMPAISVEQVQHAVATLWPVALEHHASQTPGFSEPRRPGASQ